MSDGLVRVLANYRDKLGGSNVVPRIPVILRRNAIEVLFEKLFLAGESVASAHANIMAD